MEEAETAVSAPVSIHERDIYQSDTERSFAELAAHNTPTTQFIKASKIGDLMAKC